MDQVGSLRFGILFQRFFFLRLRTKADVVESPFWEARTWEI
jgi:hypothetical protein